MANTKKVAAPKGKTIRATMIGVLLKHQNKVVSIDSIKQAVMKAKHTDKEPADKKIVQRSKQVATWAKRRNLKLVKKSKGFALKAA